MENLSIFIAFGAGLMSFLSPCVLPLVPAYIAYITGASSDGGRIFTVLRSLAFVLGFSVVFVLMGASASYVGQFLFKYRTLINRVGGVLIVIFGLHTSGVLKINLLYRQFRLQEPTVATSYLGSTLMGIAFAAGWTPCVGTVLGSILLYASSEATLYTGILLLSFYSLGLGIPFVLTAIFIDRYVKVSSKFNNYLPVISKVSGILMVAFGVVLFFDKVQSLSRLFY